MKRVYIFLILIYSTTFSFVFSQQSEKSKYKLEIPQLKPNEYVISHSGFSLSYNEPNEQANWVTYELTKEETNSTEGRTNKFIVDPLVKTGSASNEDYAGSGYDRGHLAPAADMGWSSESMHDCFYYSNMSPQNPSFNRGFWKRAESLVRSWAIEYKDIYIVTGPVLNKGLSNIGANKVSVSKYYYKVILDNHDSNAKGIGFIFPNCSSTEPLLKYVVTIDSVEKVTGIDFFPLLPDEQEKKIESSVNINAWIWKSTSTSNHTSKSTAAVQCKGTTKAGNRCKKRTTNSSGYCNLHS